MFINMDNINIKEFDKICRTCMSDCTIKFFRDYTVTNIYYKLTDIHFDKNDELPQQICLPCFEKINEIHRFAFLCKRTHSNLIECLNKSKNIGSNKNQEIIDETMEIETSMDATNDPAEINKKLTIGKFLQDEDLNSTKDDVINELENKQVINKGTSNELMEDIISEEIEFNNKQIINFSENDLSNDENEDKSNITANLKDKKKNKGITKKTKKGDKLYKCKQCSMLFNYLGHMKTHMRTHSCERPHVCKFCAETFNCLPTFKRHLSTHTDKRAEPEPKSEPEPEGRYKCDQCPKSFSNFRYRTAHKRTHSGERIYKCVQCPRVFAEHNSLQYHLRSHSGERPYTCEHCPKTFYRSYELTRHHLRMHTGERPYKCDQCSKSYVYFGILKFHKRAHRDECL